MPTECPSCDVVYVRTSRSERRRAARKGLTLPDFLPAHSDECPMRSDNGPKGWQVVGRVRSAFHGQ
jgi:hypothetical protein